MIWKFYRVRWQLGKQRIFYLPLILHINDTAYKIAEHLNVSLDWLLTGKIITENSNSFTDNLNKLNEGNFALIKNLVNSLIDKQEY